MWFTLFEIVLQVLDKILATCSLDVEENDCVYVQVEVIFANDIAAVKSFLVAGLRHIWSLMLTNGTRLRELRRLSDQTKV